MKNKFLTLILFSISLSGFAQQTLHQVIVLNEGHFNFTTQQIETPVTLAAYNPQNGDYTVFDTIEGARFASDVLIDGGFIYAAADTQIYKYDLNTYQLVDTKTVSGVRSMKVWNNLLLVTRGEYGVNYNSYFQAYDKNTLQFSFELDTIAGPKYASEGIVIKDDVAYIAVNNGFDWGNEVGLIGKIDLSAQSYISETDLGPDGKNPEPLFIKGDKIYSLNNKSFDGASISEFEITTGARSTLNINSSNSCKGSTLVNNHIAFQSNVDDFLGRYSLSTSTVTDTLYIGKSVYDITNEPVNNNIYISETDFLTYGTVFIYDGNGTPLTSFSAGVAPGAFAFDVRNTSDVQQVEPNKSGISVFPTLVKDELTVVTKGMENENTAVTVTDCLGRVVFSQSGLNRNMNISRIDLSANASGIYFVNVKSGDKNFSQKVVKM